MKTMKTTARFPLFTTPATMLAMLTAPFAVIAANTFTAASGDWNTAANWSEGVPVAGQAVVIDGDATLTNATPALGSLTVNSARTLTVDGWDTLLSATNVMIAGTVTHVINDDQDATDGWTPNARVNVACTDLSIPVGGTINLLGKGFQGGVYTNGYGPGRGNATLHRGGGGGYGGPGSSAVGYGAFGGAAYGSASHPDLPGSGGGSTFGVIDSTGGAGGGLLQIHATGDVVINGTIVADGANGVNHCPGAGSGGGVYIQCATLDGAGTISAKGGTSWVGGGGGRISIDITDTAAQTLLTPTLKLTCEAFKGGGDTRYQPGSLYFSSQTFFPHATLDFGSYVLVIGGASAVTLDSLTVTAGEPWMALENGLDVAGNMTVRNSGTRLVLTNVNASCDGDLALESGTRLDVHASATNGVSPGYGNRLDVGGSLTVGTGAMLALYAHPTNGGSVFIDAGSLNVVEGGGIDADGKGFGGGPGRNNGYGPGGGVYMGNPADRGGGGGYGGRGATHTWGVGPAGGTAYGNAYAPTLPGSGAAGKSGKTGGAGGGLIWMRVRRSANIDGTVAANGAVTPEWTCGDGAGGGIFLDCGDLSGSGAITANGGMITGLNGANGGGGRIAVWEGVSDVYRARFLSGNFSAAIITNEPPSTFTGTVTASCGTVGYEGEKAEPGTIVFLTSPPLGTLIIVR